MKYRFPRHTGFLECLVRPSRAVRLCVCLFFAIHCWPWADIPQMVGRQENSHTPELDAQIQEVFAQAETVRRGMLPSEVRLVLNATRFYHVDLLLESGTAHGVSTEMFSRIRPDLEVHTFDLDMYGVHDQTKERLARCCPNVTTHIGDATKLLPAFLRKCRDRIIGVTVDGPKAKRALSLARSLIRFPQVRFVTIHDTAPFWGYGQNTIAGTIKYTTWNDAYRERYGSMDLPYIQKAQSENERELMQTGCGLDLFVKQTSLS